MQISLLNLIDNTKIYKTFRKLRWKNGCYCPFCHSNKLRKRGKHSRHEGCQRYECLKCDRRFDDLTGTIFSGRHQSVAVWVVYVYLMGLNVSNAQIAQELSLCGSNGQKILIVTNYGGCRKPLSLQNIGETASLLFWNALETARCKSHFIVAGIDSIKRTMGTVLE
jgi:transposase-like protein